MAHHSFKFLLLLVSLVLVLSVVQGQPSAIFDFIVRESGISETATAFSTDAIFRNVADNAGNSYVIGQFTGVPNSSGSGVTNNGVRFNSSGLGGNPNNSTATIRNPVPNQPAYFVAKFNSRGQPQWVVLLPVAQVFQNSFPVPFPAFQVRLDPDQSTVFVVGTYVQSIRIGNRVFTSAAQSDLFLLRLRAGDGFIQFADVTTSNDPGDFVVGSDLIRSCQSAGQVLYVAGTASGSGISFGNASISTPGSSQRAFILTVDATNGIPRDIALSSGVATGTAIALDCARGPTLYLAGNFSAGSQPWDNPTNGISQGCYLIDFFLSGTNVPVSSLNSQQTVAMEAAWCNSINLRLDGQGRQVIAGSWLNSDLTVPVSAANTRIFNNQGGNDLFVVVTNLRGFGGNQIPFFQQATAAGSPGDDYCYGADVDMTRNLVYCSGQVSGLVNNFPNQPNFVVNGSPDGSAMVLVFNANNNLQPIFQQLIGNGHDDSAFGVSILQNGSTPRRVWTAGTLDNADVFTLVTLPGGLQMFFGPEDGFLTEFRIICTSGVSSPLC